MFRHELFFSADTLHSIVTLIPISRVSITFGVYLRMTRWFKQMRHVDSRDIFKALLGMV